jgi:SagB-type dehydrogenase family enzyme
MDMTTFLRWTEMERTNLPEFLEQAERYSAGEPIHEPRDYPGYPTWPLPRVRPRRLTALDRTLLGRRCVRPLGTAGPDRRLLGRLHQYAHGVCGPHGRGPVPSAGALQAVELYEVHFDPSTWLPAGLYHYDRADHRLAQIAAGAQRTDWADLVPAWRTIEGGALLWILVGDAARTTAKYGARGLRFLMLEAGHLMQNLCLLSASVGWSTVPLGGFFEREIGRRLALPPADAVLYAGVCGRAS